MSLFVYVGMILFTLLVSKILHGWIFNGKKLMDLPGPKGWPLVGNALQMDPSNPHKTFSEWRRMYGDMFKIKIFRDDIIVLNDYESIQEMLTSQECSSRPHIFRLNEIALKDMKDVGFHSYSPEWNERKEVLSRSLDTYGAGLMEKEPTTMYCIEKLFEDIFKDTNNFAKSIDIKPHIHVCTAGIITTLLYGRKLAKSELLELLELESGLLKFISAADLSGVIDHFPWMQYLPLRAIQGPIHDAKNFRSWILDRQMERRSLVKDEQCILDSLSTFVNKVTKLHLTHKELAGIAADIVLGGFASSTAFLYSLIAVLINFPECQERMHEEIQYVTKGSRPKVSDQSIMTYSKAVIEETFRYASVAPLTPPHRAMEDTVISGKNIPKGTNLVANLWSLHHDERYFDKPWKFKPERFLDENGQMLPREDPVRKYSMPFSAGRRVCSGESLARNMIFLIIASLIQRYKFVPEDFQNIPSCDPHEYEGGLMIMPFKYKVKILER